MKKRKEKLYSNEEICTCAKTFAIILSNKDQGPFWISKLSTIIEYIRLSCIDISKSQIAHQRNKFKLCRFSFITVFIISQHIAVRITGIPKKIIIS